MGAGLKEVGPSETVKTGSVSAVSYGTLSEIWKNNIVVQRSFGRKPIHHQVLVFCTLN